MTYLDWLDEANGKLTRVLLKHPDSDFIVDPIRKHVIFALERPELAKVEKVVMDTIGRMTAAAVNYPELQDEFLPTVEKGRKYWGQ